MAKNCCFYFGVVIFIATFPISFPIVMYLDSKKKNESSNVAPSNTEPSPDPSAPQPTPSAPPDQSENPIQNHIQCLQKNVEDSDEPTNL
jgi:hypothetical protein